MEFIRRNLNYVIAGAVLAVLVFGGIKAKQLFDQNLSEAQGKVLLATANATAAEARATAALTVARDANQRADSAAVVAQVASKRATAFRQEALRHSAAADSLAKLAPDTCDTYLQAMAGARDLANETAEQWRLAYVADSTGLVVALSGLDSVTIALTALKASSAILRGASSDLVKASHRGFFAGLLPKAGFGGAVGIDPATGKFSKAVGLTLSWSF